MVPFTELVAAVTAGTPVALATVVGVRGSTPRHLGARMAIAADGQTWGTIGGGRIEVETIAAGRAVAALYAVPKRGREHAVEELIASVDRGATLAGYARLDHALRSSLARDLPKIGAVAAGLVAIALLLSFLRGTPLTPGAQFV